MSVEGPVEWLKRGIELCLNVYTVNVDENREQFAELDIIYHQLAEQEKETIHKFIREELAVDDGLYIVSVIVKYMDIPEFWDDAVYFILKGKYDCYTRCMLEVQFYLNEKGSYLQRKELHAKSIECLNEELQFDRPYIPVEMRNEKRIVMITEQILDNGFHSPTNIMLRFIYIMRKYLGYEIMVIACPSDRLISPALWKYPMGYNSSQDRIRKIHYKELEIEVLQFPMSVYGSEEFQEMISAIYEWNPLFVLNLGINNPVPEVLQNITSLVKMDQCASLPVTCAEIIIRYDRKTEEVERMYAQTLKDYQTQIYLEGKLPIIISDSNKEFTRKELGLPEEKFLIAVVGNRLDKEIDTDFAAVMRQILIRNANAAFVIIGSVQKVNELLKQEIPEGDIYYLGYRTDLPEVCRVLDLYLNPRRGGGGLSGAIALKADVPVLTLPDCDVAHYAGEGFTVGNYGEMVESAVRYAENADFYKMKKAEISGLDLKDGKKEYRIWVEKLVDKIRRKLLWE